MNDGNEIPGIAYGTWRMGNGRGPIDEVNQAISVGFHHIDTAQLYGNEKEVGIAIKESGLSRQDIFITTKYSHIHQVSTDILASIKDSLRYLGVAHVDLYLIHYLSAAVPDIPTSWRYLEDFKRKGWAKSIGVSNYGIDELKALLSSAKIKPVVNQIMLNPYVYPDQAPLIDFCKTHGIAIEAYGALRPITQMPGGPLDKPLAKIAGRRRVASEQILLAWVKAKGAISITSSSKKERLQLYLAAGDIELTDTDVAIIDAAGKEGAIPVPPY